MNAEHPRTESTVIPPAKGSALNFEAFAIQPEYQGVNRALVEKLFNLLPNPYFHVDVATGTGLVLKLLREESQKTGKKGTIFGIDPNATSLEIARKTTMPSEDVSVEFIEGFGQDLEKLLQDKIPEEGVDGVSILDAIHEISGENEKTLVLSSMADILKPGGVLVLNSAFTTYGMEPSPMAWGKWKLRAFKNLDRKQNRNINAIKLHTPDEYKQMLEEFGLTVIHEEKKVVNLSWEALSAISLYPEFINGVFRDMIGQENFTSEEKSQALTVALEGVGFISRGWYEIIAQKSSLNKN